MRHYLQLVTSALLASVPVVLFHITIHAQDAPKKKPDVPVLVQGQTNWGKLHQQGRNFKLTGHREWEAVGVIREDGRIFILWTLLADGEPCPGMYRANADGTLTGEWAYGYEVKTCPKTGTMTGPFRSDRIYAVEVQPDL